ncbi:hypothetical protein L198_00413 [Cryptococcus wingfieldii CBS 7118]|uniref:Stress-activated map kinase-interacting protein 1 n=1 Tax=Cryptococcus wingfieldii CBS 7118 TaxID=1295528 RepID=A0A1E3K6B0_9TREE|nr:hypothetical protein L198_00413 [Cryptococcus wingfieldii CBS 7118]ODO08680.1 hypothetical protein L198_00413 [Cryptococcus wingfieldii CBS 7118]
MLQAIRLSSLRATDDPLSPRIISLDPSFGANPYINASGLSDLDRWPEIGRALDSPPLDGGFLSGQTPGSRPDDEDEGKRGGGLKYTQTIMGPGKLGGAGMRVSGRHANPGESRRGQAIRANSSASIPSARSPNPPKDQEPSLASDTVPENDLFTPSVRPRADSAPMPGPLPSPPRHLASSVLSTGKGATAGLLQRVLSSSQMSAGSNFGMDGTALVATPEEKGSSIGIEATTGTQTGVDARMVAGLEDQGSDVDEEEAAEADVRGSGREATAIPGSRRASVDTTSIEENFDFTPIPIVSPSLSVPRPSALTSALNKYVPHLVSTGPKNSSGPISPIAVAPINPFYSLYSSIAAPPGAPFEPLELYFPHSKNPTQPLVGKVRKDATVEEVTGYGLWRYWEEGRKPKLEEEEEDVKWSSVGWGLRIVEDDGEVDEDFPALDRESKISKFSYGQFAIVEATEEQIRQNASKAPTIPRRPSRVIPVPASAARPVPPPTTRQPSTTLAPPRSNQPPSASSSFSSSEFLSTTPTAGNAGGKLGSSMAMKGSVGLSSTGSDVVRLKVKVTASADVHFTTTINVPADMYIADLTEVLCRKKRLQMPAHDWVLCLADLTLALPLDRTVASLEGRTELALVKRTWAVDRGVRIDDRRGGDPSASIFKRQSEPAPFQRFGPGLSDFSQTYKASARTTMRFQANAAIAIGRHERNLAIDGDYIHIMPSESRAFFDSMKTTSFHISLVAACKLTGRAGGFKINVWRDGTQKRYEFEAENQRQAVEIVSTIRQLMKAWMAENNNIVPAPGIALRK